MRVLVTVIVPIYKHWDLMPRFFSKISKQTFKHSELQIIIVDNGSPHIPDIDTLPEFVTLLTCLEPGSYAARNKGIQHAKGELLIFTDADCLPDSDWIEKHWGNYKKNGSNIINAGEVVVKKLNPGVANKYELYDSFFGIPQRRYVVKRGYAVTANLGVPRTLFDFAGAFDDKRFSGGDAEFCQRAVKAGAGLCFVAEAKVFHPARSTWRELETKARRVKGGQIRNGSLARRAGFFFKSFLYPFLAAVRVIRSSMTNNEKRQVLQVVLRLAVVEIFEVLRLIFGGKMERR